MVRTCFPTRRAARPRADAGPSTPQGCPGSSRGPRGPKRRRPAAGERGACRPHRDLVPPALECRICAIQTGCGHRGGTRRREPQENQPQRGRIGPANERVLLMGRRSDGTDLHRLCSPFLKSVCRCRAGASTIAGAPPRAAAALAGDATQASGSCICKPLVATGEAKSCVRTAKSTCRPSTTSRKRRSTSAASNAAPSVR